MLLRTGRGHVAANKIKGKGFALRPCSVEKNCINGIELLCSVLFVYQIMRWRHRDLPNSVILNIMKSGAELTGNRRSLTPSQDNMKGTYLYIFKWLR